MVVTTIGGAAVVGGWLGQGARGSGRGSWARSPSREAVPRTGETRARGGCQRAEPQGADKKRCHVPLWSHVVLGVRGWRWIRGNITVQGRLGRTRVRARSSLHFASRWGRYLYLDLRANCTYADLAAPSCVQHLCPDHVAVARIEDRTIEARSGIV